MAKQSIALSSYIMHHEDILFLHTKYLPQCPSYKLLMYIKEIKFKCATNSNRNVNVSTAIFKHLVANQTFWHTLDLLAHLTDNNEETISFLFSLILFL